MKNTMTTFTGRHFDPMQIRTEDICIEDIAHALSLICRGGGHLKYILFRKHSTLSTAPQRPKPEAGPENFNLPVSFTTPGESYISDIIRPVKANLTGYLEIESRIMEKIPGKFNLSDLTEEERRMWKQIDDEMLYYELKNLMSGEEDWPHRNCAFCLIYPNGTGRM